MDPNNNLPLYRSHCAKATTELGEIFNMVMDALDLSTRQQLSDTLQTRQSRRSGKDRYDQFMFFHHVRDNVLEAIGRSHLPEIMKDGGNCLHHNRHLCCSYQPVVENQHNTPLNDCKSLSEDRMFSVLDTQARREYVITKFTSQKECLQIGYRYLFHLMRPDLPLEHTIRQLPSNGNESCCEAQHEEESEEDSDDEMYYSDDESYQSDISDITIESDIKQRLQSQSDKPKRTEQGQ